MMNKIKRVFLIVLDSFGIGEAPDSSFFGDKGCNTFKSLAESGKLNIPNLIKLGFGNIDGVNMPFDQAIPTQIARLQEKSMGKDTTIGHWEIAGVVSEKPLPTFPNGFPQSFIDAFSKAVGRPVICNKAYSGTEVIKDYGEEHIRTGALICYTSADSVFQIAAHEDIVPTEELYKYCRIARQMLTGDLGIGRVIARPFNGEYPFKRTKNRHDFSLAPSTDTMLDHLKNNDFDVIGVGKINDIFANQGITEYIYTENNTDGMSKTSDYQKRDFNGLCFVNLVDFDMVYGHRRNCNGYATAISEFDCWLGDFIKSMKNDDALIITADHGCDPNFKGTDHTREYVPFVLYGNNIEAKNLGTVQGFDHIAKTVTGLLKG